MAGLFRVGERGTGQVVVNNTSTLTLVLPKNFLVARGRIAKEESTVRDLNVASVVANDPKPISEADLNLNSTLSPELKIQLLNLLNKYRSCFAFNLSELGHTTAGDMTITLHDNEPVIYRPYRLAISEKEKVREMVSELLQHNIIRPSTSSYASPIVVVREKSGELRLCIDYRALNRKTVRETYPMPLIDDQLDVLSGNQYYTTLDLASGYYQRYLYGKQTDTKLDL